MATADPDAPLEHVAEVLFGDVSESLEHIQDHGRRKNTRGLMMWYLLNAALQYKFIAHPFDFPGCLSVNQYHSLRVLREWWCADYQPPEMSLFGILDIVDKSDEFLLESEKDRKMLDTVITSLSVRYWPKGDIQCNEPNKVGFYNYCMRRLFRLEFQWGPKYRSSHILMDHLREDRIKSKLIAYCQQLKGKVYREACEDIYESTAASRSAEDQRHAREEIDMARLKASRPAFVNEMLPPLDLVSGPPIKPCHWLPQISRNCSSDLPYYLWDRHTSSTILTANLPQFVDYTAISHTWGRWRKSDPPVTVAGVPWKVPENEQFDVKSLSARLARLPGETRYLWFDLFCIPQDRSELATAEIARQALIFRNARTAIAWIRDVDSFDGLAAVLLYMLCKLLRVSVDSADESYRQRMLDISWHGVAYSSTGLLEPRNGSFQDFSTPPNSWFTSLWTLQELCLRPDMWLCSSNGQPLSVAWHKEGEPLPIMGILAIWWCFWHQDRLYEDPTDTPLGFDPFQVGSVLEPGYDGSHIAFAEFFRWILSTNLDKLPTISWIHLLSLGDKRVCTKRRAEAIMSALGATRWYDELPQSKHEESLVLGKYPLAFIQELKEADPGRFFGRLTKWDAEGLGWSGDGVPNYAIISARFRERQSASTVEYKNFQGQPRGSMLPFSQDGAIFGEAHPAYTADYTTHGSLRKWHVREDGSVHILEACILAGSGITRFGDGHLLEVLNFGNLETDDVPYVEEQLQHGGTRRVIDLEAWIHSRPFEVYAVVTTQQKFDYSTSTRAIVANDFCAVVLAWLDEDRLVQIGTVRVYVDGDLNPAVIDTDWIVA